MPAHRQYSIMGDHKAPFPQRRVMIDEFIGKIFFRSIITKPEATFFSDSIYFSKNINTKSAIVLKGVHLTLPQTMLINKFSKLKII